MNNADTKEVYVWDLLVRIFHWSLVAAFLIAYFVEAEDQTLAVHVWAGYAVGGLVILRIIWGFVGTKHARFIDFLFGPFAAIRYLFDLIRGHSKRYLGHSPAGAWMVFMLLLGLAGTVLSGIALYAEEENKGPLAPLFADSEITWETTVFTPAYADEYEDYKSEGKVREKNSELFEEVHEVLANLTVILLILHIGGVILASIVHRENIVRSMISGKKRA
jgi:cytochrome b